MRSPAAPARVAAVAILLAVTVLGLRAHGTFSRAVSATAATAGGAALATALAVAEGFGLVAFILVLAMARPARPRYEPYLPPLPWWARPLAVLAALATLVTPFVVLLAVKARKKATPPLAVHPGVPLPGTGHLTAPSPSSSWPFVAGMALAVATVIALVLLTRARRASQRSAARALRARAALLDSLTAGQDALTRGGDPRQAIIACYAAMERGFAAAGSAPAAADTPAEVLTRATGAGIVRSGSAERLTGIFRRARYSPQPMTEADSGQAADALAQMRAELAAQQP